MKLHSSIENDADAAQAADALAFHFLSGNSTLEFGKCVASEGSFKERRLLEASMRKEWFCGQSGRLRSGTT